MKAQPTLTVKAANAPFQMEWTLDASTLQSTDARRLFDALKVELHGANNCPFFDFSDCGRRFKIMDPTADVVALVESLVQRFNDRHNAQDDEEELLPSIAWHHRLMAYLFPTGQRRNSYEVLPMLYSNGRHSFDIKLSATAVDLPFLRALKALHKSPSLRGNRVKVRANSITISSDSRRTTYDMGRCISKLLGQRKGRDEQAISPAALLPYYLLCTPAE